MRVINTKGETITDYDLTKGRLIAAKAIRTDATPIDNVKKFAWDSGDFENVQMFLPNREGGNTKESTEQRIEKLEKGLKNITTLFENLRKGEQ